MLVVWIAIVVVVAGAVIARVFWRPSSDEIHSVDSHRTALQTMEHLAGRTGSRSVRVVDQTGADQVSPGAPGRAAGPGGRVPPPLPVRGSDEWPDPDTPLVFDETRPPDDRGIGETGSRPVRTDRVQRQALASMNHRPRRWLAATLTVVVIMAVTALAVAGSHRRAATASHASTSTTASPEHGSAVTTATTRPVHRSTRPTRPTPPTTTTLPTRIVALSSTATTAEYTSPASTYQLMVSATGTCWIEAKTAATGAVVFAGVLDAGADQAIDGSGTMTLELGTSAASVTLNGIPVVLPSPVHTPFIATFQAPTSAPTSATSTTPVP